MYRKILVPLDGSKTAEGVLPHAKALAYSEGAQLILLTVAANPALDYAFSDPGIAQSAEREQQSRSKKYMADMEAELKAAGFKVSTVLRVGAVADVILSTAEELQADAIAMSTHGRTGPARWLLGSVAEKVVRTFQNPSITDSRGNKMILRDRVDAGKQLAERLAFLEREKNLVVLGIPRGGVVVAAEIARALNAPLDVFMAHKLGAPENPEFAIGAVTSAGEAWFDEATITEWNLDRAEIERRAERERSELTRRAALYRGQRAALRAKDKLVIVVDDGIATGATMFAAVRALRCEQPARLMAAIPVGPVDTIAQLRNECEVMVLETPAPFYAVGNFYAQFEQTQDDAVIRLLREFSKTPNESAP